MAVERGYERQVAPGGTAGLPGASPDAFGAGVGRGVEGVGGALMRSEVDADRIERQQHADAEAADFNARFAQARDDMDRLSIDARNNAPAGAPGHAAAFEQTWAERRTALLDGIREDSVRRKATSMVDEFGLRLGTAEYQYETGARIGKVATDQQAASDLGANRARRSHDLKSYEEELSLGRQAIDAMEGVPADVREKLARYHDETVTVGYVNGLVDTNPPAAVAMLDAGMFDDVLSPAQIERLRGGGMVETRRIAVAQEQAVAAERSELREEIGLIDKQLGAGITVDDAVLEKAQARATAAGLDLQAFDLALARKRSAINREFADASPVQIDAQIKAIRSKGDKASPEEQVSLKHLETLYGQRRAEWRDDPLAAGARAGYAVAPIAWTDPATIAARRRTAEAIGAQQGQAPVYLSAAETAELATAANGTPAQRLQVSRQLSMFGGAAALRAAKQVAPDDLVLQRAALLNPQAAELALSGAEARKGNAALVPKLESDEAFGAFVGRSLDVLDPGMRTGTIETARNIYAELARRNGATEFGEQGFINAVNLALGRANGRGGIGVWAGAPVLLPSTMSQAEFDAALAVPGERLRAASNGNPRYGDGAPVSMGELRKRFRPVAVADGLYQFELPSGAAVMAGDVPWVVDLRRLR